MALATGIAKSPCRLLQENWRSHFMTRRFDRDGDRRHHMQTLCALARLDYKQVGTHSYNQLFQTAQALQLGRPALAQTLRRMVFNVLAVNNDDHTNNFSFLLREGGRWELAPAYDVTHAYRPDSERVRDHQMSVNGRFDGITRADVRVVAERFGVLAELPKAIDAVADAVGRWSVFAREAGIAAEETARIGEHMAGRRRVFGA